MHTVAPNLTTWQMDFGFISIESEAVMFLASKYFYPEEKKCIKNLEKHILTLLHVGQGVEQGRTRAMAGRCGCRLF